MSHALHDKIRNVIKVVGPTAGVQAIGDVLEQRGVFFDEEDIKLVLRLDFPPR